MYCEVLQTLKMKVYIGFLMILLSSRRLIFINGGVKLTIQSSAVLAELQEYEERVNVNSSISEATGKIR